MEMREPIKLLDGDVTIELDEKYRDFEAKVLKSPIDRIKPFWPIRVVINFKIVHKDDQDLIQTVFDPPFVLRIRYTHADEKCAEKRGEPLQLAYWDCDHWVRFTVAEHEFRLEPDPNGNGGVGIAKIKEWPDPPNAWGT